jgi:Domain of unknown function (DUF4131)
MDRHRSSVISSGPPRQPLLWAALAYAAGITLGSFAWRPPLWWLIAALVLAASVAYLVRRRPKSALSLALAALTVLGALTIQVRGPLGNRDPIPEFANGQDVVITAHVIHEGSATKFVQRSGAGDLRQRLDLETESISTETRTAAARFGIRATFYSKEAQDESDAPTNAAPTHIFRYGERIRFPPSSTARTTIATLERSITKAIYRNKASSR